MCCWNVELFTVCLGAPQASKANARGRGGVHIFQERVKHNTQGLHELDLTVVLQSAEKLYFLDRRDRSVN